MEEQAVNNQIQQPPVNPVAPKQNYWLIAIIVVTVLFIGLGSYFLFYSAKTPSLTPYPTVFPRSSPTTDETANWKIYTNTEYGFRIKYPEQFKEYGYEKRIDSFAVQSDKTRDAVIINIVPQQKSLQVYLTELEDLRGKAYEGNSSVQVLKKQQIQVAGKLAVQQEINLLAAALSEIETFIDVTPKMIISISVRGGDGGTPFDSLRTLNNQILSTFKFLKQSPSVTCIPRPACLDAVPRCLIPESENMCPPKPTSNQVVCTQDAKQCPDGSYVSRQPPSCEFAKCP